jgi:hypothetical protein
MDHFEKSALAKAAAAPVNWDGNKTTVPMFWQEGKSPELFGALLDNFSGAEEESTTDKKKKPGCRVLDLTGNPQLAKACLRKGLHYVGVALSKDHANWMSNVIDAEAIKVLCDTGHTLWQQRRLPWLCLPFRALL